LPTRSVGPTNRSAGLLVGRTHLSGAAVSLVGGDPGVPMSHTNALTHVWIWIRYVNCIFLGVFSERTKIEVVLIRAVPSVKNGLLEEVARHVPTQCKPLAT
jgi:hypothetical protein